jgi:hypothetical protein
MNDYDSQITANRQSFPACVSLILAQLTDFFLEAPIFAHFPLAPQIAKTVIDGNWSDFAN